MECPEKGREGNKRQGEGERRTTRKRGNGQERRKGVREKKRNRGSREVERIKEAGGEGKE